MIKEYKINTIVLHITTVCNHSCPFCYFTSNDIPKRHQSYAILRRIISECAEAGAKDILFVGGDPATHPNIIDISNFAHELGMQTAILSNTLEFNERTKNEVINAFDFIETTIHSHDAKLHDDFCGYKGAFDKVIRNLSSLASIKTHLGIVYNLTQFTYDNLFNTVNSLVVTHKIPLDHIVLQRIVEVGRASNNDSWNLSVNNLQSVFLQADNLRKKLSISISFEDTFPYCKIPIEYRDMYSRPCSWGYDCCSLDLDGNVSLCCTDPNYDLGNIFRTPLLQIWNHNEKLTKKRNGLYIPETCRACKDYQKCRGGCILSSIMNNGNGDKII